MIIAFIDESGQYSPKDKDPFVISSILTWSDKTLTTARNELQCIKLNYGLDPSFELHSKFLFHPKDPLLLTIKNNNKLNDLITDIANLIANLNDITIISAGIRKNSKSQVSNINSISSNIMKTAYEFLIERILKFAANKRPGDWIIFVHDWVDINAYGRNSKKQSIITQEINNITRDGTYASKISSRTRIIQPVIFTNSANNSMLQLVDFTAYIVRRYVNNKLSNNMFPFNGIYNTISTKFDKSPSGTIDGWGLKTWRY